MKSTSSQLSQPVPLNGAALQTSAAPSVAPHHAAACSVEMFKSLQLRLIQPEDIVSLANERITALSISEVLVISQSIEHQLTVLKRGVLGSDVESFVGTLLASKFGGHGDVTRAAFPRMPSSSELHLCRKLAHISDDDIVTQVQILRMLDVFRKLTILYEKTSSGVVEGLLVDTAGGTSPLRLNRQQQNETERRDYINELIELNSDVAASTSALTEGSMFEAPAADGAAVIPTHVLIELADKYQLDARPWFKKYSSVSLLPSSDDVVVALRCLLSNQRSSRKTAAQPSSDDESPRGGGAVASSLRVLSHGPATPSKSTAVPVEFISSAVLTESFMPVSRNVLDAFCKTFHAFDPNDPVAEFNALEHLVDGHLLLVIPIPQFASVLGITVLNAHRIIHAALEHVPPPPQANHGTSLSGSVKGVSNRKGSRTYSEEAPFVKSLGNMQFDEIDDMFGSGVVVPNSVFKRSGSIAMPLTSAPSVSLLQTGGPGSPAGTAASANALPLPAFTSPNSTTSPQQAQTSRFLSSMLSSTIDDTLPVDYATVRSRGYLRFPEFTLVLRYLDGRDDVLEKKKDEQQTLVDNLLSQHSGGGGGGGAPSDITPLSRKVVPDAEQQKMLQDEQAQYLENMLFSAERKEAKEGKKKLTPQQPAATSSSPSPHANETKEVALHVDIPAAPVLTAAQESAGAISPRARERPSPPKVHPRSTRGPEGPPSLRGWPIHEHHPGRSAKINFNERDAHRLRRSIVATPDRNIQSFANPAKAEQQAAAALVAQQQLKESSKTSRRRRNVQAPGDALIASNYEGALHSAGGGAGTAEQAAAAAHTQFASWSEQHRDLAKVLDLERLFGVVTSLPDDPVLSTSAAGGQSSSLMASTFIQSSPVNNNNSNSSPGGGNLPTGASFNIDMTSLFLPSQQHRNNNNNNNDVDDGFDSSMNLSVRKSLPGGATSSRGPSLMPLGSPSSLQVQVVSRQLGTSMALSLTTTKTPRGDRQVQVVLGDSNHTNRDEEPTTRDIPIPFNTSDETPRINEKSPARLEAEKKKNGIHEKPWRAVKNIPKLDQEAVSDYCSTAKRSGGGFGCRGRSDFAREESPGRRTLSPLLSAVEGQNTNQSTTSPPESTRLKQVISDVSPRPPTRDAQRGGSPPKKRIVPMKFAFSLPGAVGAAEREAELAQKRLLADGEAKAVVAPQVAERREAPQEQSQRSEGEVRPSPRPPKVAKPAPVQQVAQPTQGVSRASNEAKPNDNASGIIQVTDAHKKKGVSPPAIRAVEKSSLDGGVIAQAPATALPAALEDQDDQRTAPQRRVQSDSGMRHSKKGSVNSVPIVCRSSELVTRDLTRNAEILPPIAMPPPEAEEPSAVGDNTSKQRGLVQDSKDPLIEVHQPMTSAPSRFRRVPQVPNVVRRVTDNDGIMTSTQQQKSRKQGNVGGVSPQENVRKAGHTPIKTLFPGGSLLSFIPSALAAEAFDNLDLRRTFPPASFANTQYGSSTYLHSPVNNAPPILKGAMLGSKVQLSSSSGVASHRSAGGSIVAISGEGDIAWHQDYRKEMGALRFQL